MYLDSWYVYSRTSIFSSPDQPAPSPTTTPATTPHSPDLQKYIGHLKDRYINRSPILKEKVLKIRPKQYIHLNLVNDEEEDMAFKSECQLSLFHGDVAALKMKKRPMEMEEIGRSEGQTVLQRILVEGSPGIGKTMFSWELCRQWAEGNMLQDRDIVLMLQLRSKRVREANNLSDIFHHSNVRIKQEVLDHITSVDGRGVFLVLDGYDELAEDQKTEGSILDELLTGECLPKATIMVTSRPIASDSLCPEFKERVDQHIEIVGFNDEDITSYVESACKKDAQILPDLKSYISCNPFVFSVMYIPLQCALVTALYVEKWKRNKGNMSVPTTLTQLYKDVLLSSLIRYISDNPVYSKCSTTAIRQLSDLPSEVQDQVWQLSKLAAVGLEEKRFIFDSIPCDHMGLMQCTEEELVIGSSVSYCFLHLTLQEYLAALYWSRLGPEDIVRLVSKTSFFPLDSIIDDENDFDSDSKKSGYHLPALYFLSGLTKLTQFPLHLLKVSISVSLHWVAEEREFSDSLGLVEKYCLAEVGNVAKCAGNFLQILFESQSRDLTAKVFAEETLCSCIDGPLSCHVTAWCIANSDPTSQWNLIFKEDQCRIEDFVNQLQKFVDSSYQHGAIIGLFAENQNVFVHLSSQLPSLLLHLQTIEFYHDVSENFIPEDISCMLPFLSYLHKLTSLKRLVIDGGYLPSAASLPPQQCPSLSTIAVTNPVLFYSLVVPNFNTLTCLAFPLTSTDLSSVCFDLQQTSSLKGLKLITDLNTYEEVEVLGSALKQNQSLKLVDIILLPPTRPLDSFELLKQILSCHPTVEQYEITHKDLKMSQSMAALEYKEEETQASPQMNDISGDDDLELALAMSLSLEMAEEEHRKRDEEKEKEDLEHALRLSLDNN